MIQVAVVDDHPIARRGMSAMLEEVGGIVVVAALSSAAELGADGNVPPPDVILLDLYQQRDEPCLEEISRLQAESKVLVVSASGRAADVLGAIRAGASGYLTKLADAETLVAAVRTVARDGFALSPKLADIVRTELLRVGQPDALPRTPPQSTPGMSMLSPREEQALDLIAQGFTHAQAARRMGVTKATIDTYVERIRVKLHVGNKAELTRVALGERLVRPLSMNLTSGVAGGADFPSERIRVEETLARAFVVIRLAGLTEMCLVLGLDWSHYATRGPANLALTGAVIAESSCLVAAAWRRASVRAWWIGGDVAFMLACLPIGAALTSPAWAHTWVYFMYPFSVITCYAIGIAFPRPCPTVGVTGVLAAGYVLSAITIHHEVAWNVLPNALTYFANTALAWTIARELRRSARAADESRGYALAQAGALAREQERARHARMLHDRVLQTLEALAQRRGIADDDLRNHVAAEAAWLRALVEGGPAERAGGLAAGLRDLVEQTALSGVRVELNDADLARSASCTDLPADILEAVLGATREALTNVAKHAETSQATVRAGVTGDRLTVTIVDDGRGFDPQQTPWRTGLRRSITDRITEAGGRARIDSAPGDGTVVEVSIPATLVHHGQRRS